MEIVEKVIENCGIDFLNRFEWLEKILIKDYIFCKKREQSDNKCICMVHYFFILLLMKL